MRVLTNLEIGLTIITLILYIILIVIATWFNDISLRYAVFIVLIIWILAFICRFIL